MENISLQRLIEYREQLRAAAEPGFGGLEAFVSTPELEAELAELKQNPGEVDTGDEEVQALIFNYFITFPLLQVKQRILLFGNPKEADALEAMKRDYQDLANGGQLGPDEICLLPDLFSALIRSQRPAEFEEEEISEIEECRDAVNKLTSLTLEGGRMGEAFLVFANLGCKVATTCIWKREQGVYLDIEWDVIERILRSPYFPGFFSECEKEAKTLFIPYKYKKWPTLKDFLQKEHLQAYCIRELQPDVEKDFESEEGYEHFKRFMNLVAEYGGITNDVDMEALLQFVTGRRFDDAGKHLRWDGTLTNARILFYVVQKISADSTRTKFQYLKDDSFTIFSGIDGSEKKKLQGDKTEAKVTETIQGGKGFHDKAAELAKYYPSLFRD